MKLKTLLFALILPLIWVNSVSASSHIRFEFLNLENYQQEESFPFNTRNEIIVASDDFDIRTLLPIELRFRYGQKALRGTIPENPQEFCRGPTGCSREGPNIAEPQDGYFELTAIDKDGNVIASYRRGTPPVAPSPTPSPSPTINPTQPPTLDAEIENRKEINQPLQTTDRLLSDRQIAALLILIALGLLVFATSSGGCPDLCTEGDCQNCQLASVRTAVHGVEPGEIEGMIDSLDLLKWLRWSPAIGGPTPGGKELIPEVVKRAKKIAEKLKQRGMQINGVDVWATISWEECNRVSCWFFWTQTKWVAKNKEVKIPPGIYRYHDINPEAWRPDHLFNEKKKKAIHDYIEREALKHCPQKC